MYPSLEWFDKKTEHIKGEELIKGLPFKKMKNFLIEELRLDLEEPFIGSIDVFEKESDFLQKYCSHMINHKKFFYSLSFDNAEWIDE